MEWSVRFEINRPDVVFTEDHADEVMDVLKRHAPTVSYSPHSISVRFCVGANTSKQAFQTGFQVVTSALKKAGIKAPGSSIVDAEAQTLSDLDKSLQEPNVPDLVGVAEVAKILGVKKQRASQLVRVRSFPKPVARLASGPVWHKNTIARHAAQWPRTPGRPRRRRTLATVS